jgi:alpha-methylacyl-CoA racemase
VLNIEEAAVHPHNVARGVYSVGTGGAVQAAGAPRFVPVSRHSG